MHIALPKESKIQEYRVALTPEGAHLLTAEGHDVTVQKGAGVGSGFSDQDYRNAGARIKLDYPQTVRGAELILKVKEPSLQEASLLTSNQILFTYLHLAAAPALTRELMKRKVTAIGYETVQLEDRTLPLLKPMSEIAGRLASQNGAHYLRHDQGGKGKLFGGVEGSDPALVTILGAGNVGLQALSVAHGMGAKVVLVDKFPERLNAARDQYSERLICVTNPSSKALTELVKKTDVLIGAVLIPGAKAPKLVTREMVKQMETGSVIVDVAVDQGGCIETSVPTTHEEPVVFKYGVVHYGVTNMPGCVPYTATRALTHQTYPYISLLARVGLAKALELNSALAKGVNVRDGRIILEAL